jgi:hypothetical protein
MDNRGTALLETTCPTSHASTSGFDGAGPAAHDEFLRELAFILHATQTVRRAICETELLVAA